MYATLRRRFSRRSLAVTACLGLFAFACAAEEAQDDSSSDDIEIDKLLEVAKNQVDRSKPDPTNVWAKRRLEVGEEEILPGDDAEFADMAKRIQKMQRTVQAQQGASKVVRGFHAKGNACAQGRLDLDPSGLEASTRVGLFAKAGAYPVWARFSNGVGFRQSDKKVDVRGLAFKVLNVEGARMRTVAGDDAARTQDFLMTNGAITPAPDARHFMAFGEAMTGEDDSGTVLGRLNNLIGAGKFLLQPENQRILDFLAHRTAPNTKKVGSMLGDRFFTGGAFAMGLGAGDAEKSRAKAAAKLQAVPGVLQGNACTPVEQLPNKADPDYLRTDLAKRLATGTVCIDVYLQFQKNGDSEPMEDTSVEWKTPFVKVGRITFPKVDLNAGSGAKAEAFCTDMSFTPWHTLADHRPLGNIMRARRPVYRASAELRGAKPEPTGSETF